MKNEDVCFIEQIRNDTNYACTMAIVNGYLGYKANNEVLKFGYRHNGCADYYDFCNEEVRGIARQAITQLRADIFSNCSSVN